MISKFPVVRAHENRDRAPDRVSCRGKLWLSSIQVPGSGGRCIEGDGSDLFVLGNELTHVGKAGRHKLYHPIYIFQPASGCRPAPARRRRAGKLRGIISRQQCQPRPSNIYSERSSTAYMSGHRVHDNFIINQVGGGMLLGQYMTGRHLGL